jgi:ZIP family zinc transporter
MGLLANLVLVFVAGLITALATGLGALPFFVVDDVSDRWNVALWGLASGIMVSASVFGLVNEGLAYGTPADLGVGLLVGVALVVVANRVITSLDVGGGDDHEYDEAHEHDHAHHAADGDGHADQHGHGHDDQHGHDHGFDPEAFAQADLKRLALILGILTVHSFPEGVAIGVSFAELGFEGGVPIIGFSIPVLAVFMTVAISIHNVPEGLAISIPLRAMEVSKWRMVGAAVFSSLPQPIGAVIAFGFVRWAREFMPFGFGFAAGAMIYLVITEFIPEALEAGEGLPNRGHRELLVGLAAGIAVMVPLAYV